MGRVLTGIHLSTLVASELQRFSLECKLQLSRSKFQFVETHSQPDLKPSSFACEYSSACLVSSHFLVRTASFITAGHRVVKSFQSLEACAPLPTTLL